MAKTRSTFTSRAKTVLKGEVQRLGELQARASRSGDHIGERRYNEKLESANRSLNRIYSREQRPKRSKRSSKRLGGGGSAGS